MSINVSDAAQAIEFYTDVLGLTVRSDRPEFAFGGAWLDVGGQQIHLIEGDVPARCGQHFAIYVADLDVAVAELRERGNDVRDPKGVGSGRQTFVFDPSGNMIELHEPAS